MKCLNQDIEDINELISPAVLISSPIRSASNGIHGFEETFTNPKLAFTGAGSDVIFTFNDKLPSPYAISRDKSIWTINNSDRVYGKNARYIFKEAGEYTISLTVIDSCGEPYSLDDPFICKLIVKDVLQTGVTWADAEPLSGYQSHKTDSKTLQLLRSWQYVDNIPTTVSFYVSGSQSIPLTEKIYDNEKYAHLLSTHRVLEQNAHVHDRPINTIDMPQIDIYLNSSGSMTLDITDRFVGTSGCAQVSLVDDIPGTLKLFATIDNTESALVMKPSSIDVDIIPYTSDINLNITTTGLPEFTLSGPSDQRFEHTQIPLIFTAVTPEGINLPEITKSITNISLLDVPHATYNTLQLDAEYLSDVHAKTVTFDSGQSSIYATQLSGTGEYVTQSGQNISLSGTSSTFNVIPFASIPEASKVGEDNNLFQTVKSFILQETISSKQTFVDTFLRSTIGDKLSPPSFIGTQLYEKITNFCKNTSDIDTCNISSLASLAESVGYTNLSIDDTDNWPPEFKRLLDLLSIPKSQLFGYRRPILEDFDKKGFIDNPRYGANLGNLIGSRVDNQYQCDDYIVTAGTDIIARQIFNNEFIHISPMMIEESGNTILSTYPLSSYSVDWGWGLYTEEPETGIFDLHENYEFYEYKTYEKDDVLEQYTHQMENNNFTGYLSGWSPVGSIINWDDTRTTIRDVGMASDEWTRTITSILGKELRYRLDIIEQ